MTVLLVSSAGGDEGGPGYSHQGEPGGGQPPLASHTKATPIPP